MRVVCRSSPLAQGWVFRRVAIRPLRRATRPLVWGCLGGVRRCSMPRARQGWRAAAGCVWPSRQPGEPLALEQARQAGAGGPFRDELAGDRQQVVQGPPPRLAQGDDHRLLGRAEHRWPALGGLRAVCHARPPSRAGWGLRTPPAQRLAPSPIAARTGGRPAGRASGWCSGAGGGSSRLAPECGNERAQHRATHEEYMTLRIYAIGRDLTTTKKRSCRGRSTS